MLIEYVLKVKSPVEDWLNGLRDHKAQAAIDARIARLRLGLVGQVRELGAGVHEMKVAVGQGYRIYFGNISNVVFLLLCGGDERTQKADIKCAKELLVVAAEVRWVLVVHAAPSGLRSLSSPEKRRPADDPEMKAVFDGMKRRSTIVHMPLEVDDDTLDAA